MVEHPLTYGIGLMAMISMVAFSCRSKGRTAETGAAPVADAAALVAVDAGATGAPEAGAEPVEDAAAAASPETNALLAEWVGPFGGVPAFDKMDLAALKPALETGMDRQLAEIDAIVADAEPPTFENTIVALERTGRDLERVMEYWGIWQGNLSTPEFREIEKEMAPKLAEFRTKITQNRPLFARIRAVYEGGADALRPDQKRLVKVIYDDFARDGATLEGAAAERYAAIQKQLAELYTRFANNVLADEEGNAVYLTGEQLGGLPESFVQASAAAAVERKHEGEYAITNTR